MDANSVLNATQQLTPLQLLNAVDLFYKGAWDKLAFFLTILVAFAGFLVPFLVMLFQNKLFALEESKIKVELMKYCDSLKEKLSQEINSKLKEESILIEKRLEKFDLKIKQGIAGAYSGVFQLQGNYLNNQKDYEGALESYLDAIPHAIDSEDQLNLNRMLIQVIDTCLPKIYSEDIENLKHDGYDFNEIIKKLEKDNKGGIHTDQIIKIKKGLTQVQQRKRVP